MIAEINKTLTYEGGYVNDPSDAGGETKFGISKRQYPNVDILTLTRNDAVKIYVEDYWDPLRCSEFTPIETRWKLFDIGVNTGIKRAALMLQAAVGTNPDGVIGKKTLMAAISVPSHELLFTLAAVQRYHYISIVQRNATQQKFLKGWLRRASDLGQDLKGII